MKRDVKLCKLKKEEERIRKGNKNWVVMEEEEEEKEKEEKVGSRIRHWNFGELKTS